MNAVGDENERTMGTTPVSIDTNIRLAAMRQIHCAIEHQYSGDFECAITLAAASEGMIRNPDEATFRHKLKALSQKPEIQAAGGATGQNDYGNWLKHGTMNGRTVENATIPAEEAPAMVWRAITKYETAYKDVSPQMVSFANWAARWLTAKAAHQC
jgi:hypothetical protein